MVFSVQRYISCLDADSRHSVKFKRHAKNFFDSKPNDYFEQIRKLTGHRQKVVDNGGTQDTRCPSVDGSDERVIDQVLIASVKMPFNGKRYSV
ncbi:hypothetical protein KIN20_006239 [Parelaphostrongylus tenuis]|uniref:Uncharacterized protein n=1 Tax=Parelaphostrongylus tenuis TaxID=148309 RepID=A0AAD5M1G7_PARTN|nr:hypothetical protein KIN20_006239 [Parelaphostrongylus tenuis]